MAKYAKHAFQLGAYYLAQRGDSPAWYRCWIEKGQPKRVSLGTEDFGEAQEILTDWYYENRKLGEDNTSPSKMPLADVLLDYWNHHASKIRSAKSAKTELRYWNEFWQESSVADVRSVVRQEQFHDWLLAKGLKTATVNRTLETGRAAIRRAHRRGSISSAPFINMIKVTDAVSKGRALSVAELRALYDGCNKPHWRDLILLLTATAARPEAIITLQKSQMDFDARLISLNPEFREQTNKFRPVVRLTDALHEHFKDYPEGNIIMWGGKPIKRPDTGLRLARKEAGFDKTVNLYSIRHTCSRWMRMEGVDTAEIANQLGHKKIGFDMTFRYMPHAPEYLSKASAALEKLCRLAFF